METCWSQNQQTRTTTANLMSYDAIFLILLFEYRVWYHRNRPLWVCVWFHLLAYLFSLDNRMTCYFLFVRLSKTKIKKRKKDKKIKLHWAGTHPQKFAFLLSIQFWWDLGRLLCNQLLENMATTILFMGPRPLGSKVNLCFPYYTQLYDITLL